MRRREYRYAPELLERKLSPTALVTPAAHVFHYDDPEPAPNPSAPGFPTPQPSTPSNPAGPR